VSEPAAPSADVATVEALRRLKAVEAEWEAKLATARAATAQGLQLAKDEAEATVKAVAAELESERASRLEAARAAAEREAEAIVRTGAQEAEAIRSGKGKRPADQQDAIVAAVLGPFSHD
jgi:vacuolar-type H+-ATPase subunit H